MILEIRQEEHCTVMKMSAHCRFIKRFKNIFCFVPCGSKVQSGGWRISILPEIP